MVPAITTKEPAMKQYLLSVYQPDGEPPPAPAAPRKKSCATSTRCGDEMQVGRGVGVRREGSTLPSTATVLRRQGWRTC